MVAAWGELFRVVLPNAFTLCLQYFVLSSHSISLAYYFNISLNQRMKRSIFLVAAMLFSVLLSSQQLLSPDEFLPHKIGATFTPHHLLVDYYEYVAANSPYVQLVEYGKTNEQRPLILAFVSTPENLEKLEAIRTNHLRNTGLETGRTDANLDRAVCWLSFTVHGNEAAGSESSMPVLFDLADPNNTTSKAWLENTIVILDPCVNPDGYSRYTHWYRRYANTLVNPNLNSIEHQEPWPNGRVNHYLFDLNRDWAWLTQVESQQRLVQYNKWMPHVHADLHEMGINSPYYFAPAAQPYHEYITQWQSDFQMTVGKNHAKYFDQNGWLYFTREVFDLLYPSYGDTYPVYNGSIGMTYEQGGSGRGGKAGLMENGDTLTLYDRVAHHQTASLSTIEVSSIHAKDLNDNFKKFFKDAQKSPTGKYKTYIIKAGNARDKLQKLTQLLDQHMIQYGTVDANKRTNAFDYSTGKERSISARKGDLIISAAQPKGILTQVLFDPSTKLVDSLTYDITAWSLPYAFGLEAYASEQAINAKATFELPAATTPKNVDKPYAYALKWESVADAKRLAYLLRSGIKVRLAELPFQIGQQEFEAGTVLATRADNRKQPNFDAILSKVEGITTVATGFADQGKDLGSGNYTFLTMPKVAVIGDEPTSPNAFGQVWYYFEQDIEYPVSILRGNDFRVSDLDDFNVLILPEGRYSFNEEKLKALQTWVRSGGRIIAIGYATSLFADQNGFALKRKKEEEKNNATASPINSYATAERRYAAYNTPGAIFKTELDKTHPLAFGLGQYYFSLKTNGLAYSYLENNWNVAYLNADPMINGFVGFKAKAKLNETLVAGVERKGRGSIIYLVDNPLFRGFWEEGKLLFSNALFFAGQ